MHLYSISRHEHTHPLRSINAYLYSRYLRNTNFGNKIRYSTKPRAWNAYPRRRSIFLAAFAGIGFSQTNYFRFGPRTTDLARPISVLLPELIALTIGHLHGDTSVLKARSLISTPLAGSTQGCVPGTPLETIGTLDSCMPLFNQIQGVLSHNLSIPYLSSVEPSHLDKTFDHLTAFSDVGELSLHLEILQFVDRGPGPISCCLSHPQLGLRSLDLTIFKRNPKDDRRRGMSDR